MYELECLRRRTEDATMVTTNVKDTNSIMSASTKSPSKSVKSPTMSAKSSKSPKTPRSKSKSNGSAGKSRTSEIAEVKNHLKRTYNPFLKTTQAAKPNQI